VNVLSLYGKYYLYLCKCKKELPNVTGLIKYIEFESKIDLIEAYCAVYKIDIVDIWRVDVA
jgi:hypothetical protein